MALIITAIFMSVTGCTGSGTAEAEEPDELLISFTPEADPVHLELDAEGLASFLSQELDRPVRTQVDADYAATVEAMAAGHAHIATNLAPLQAAVAAERAGARLILAEERDGRASYRSRFWVLENSEFQSLEDLHGASIAFNDPLSGSGYLMPVTTLMEHGLIEGADDLESYFGNVYFAGGTELSMRALLNGHVDVAGVSENAADVFLSEENRMLVRFVAESGEMPRHAIAVSGDLPDDLVEDIKDAFLKLNDPEHNDILNGLYGWSRVVPVDEELYLPLLESARELGLIDDLD